jgi:hypothetical protein
MPLLHSAAPALSALRLTLDGCLGLATPALVCAQPCCAPLAAAVLRRARACFDFALFNYTPLVHTVHRFASHRLACLAQSSYAVLTFVVLSAARFA